MAVISYRPEIDGLRTVAVLSVIIYHAELPWGDTIFLSGGYIGVDIFFVISGYLITSLILGELVSTGGFSVMGFYERRVRRLLPALLVVTVASIVAAWQILLPAQLVDFCYSVLASLLFVSNFYWDLSLEVYGAQPALLKPMLHTWSLAVEEQYYIVFPLLFIGIYTWTRKRLILLLSILFVASLLFAQWYTATDSSSSFYMLPSRFWELLAGGLLACVLAQRSASLPDHKLVVFAPLAGLLMICVSLFLFDHDIHHPGFITLLPVLGTVLIIGFAREGDGVTRLLSSRLFVAIGLMSYSLYLWHFPIFSFARNMHSDITSLEKLVWIALTFACSIVSYLAVEKPFRDRRKMPAATAMFSIAIVSLGVVIFSVYAVQKNGVRERLFELEDLYGINEFDNLVLRKRSWSILNRLAAEQGMGRSLPLKPSEFESTRLWYSDRVDTEKVLIAGVSTTRCLFNAFYLNREKFPLTEFARFGMHRDVPPEHVAALLDSPNFKAADTVILNFSVRPENFSAYAQMIPRVVASGKRVILVSNARKFVMRNGKAPFDYHMMKQRGEGVAQLDFGPVFFADRNNIDPDMEEELTALAEQYDLQLLLFRELVCDRSKQRCDGVTPEGYKAYYDGVHWTLEGAQFFGERMAQRRWLEGAR